MSRTQASRSRPTVGAVGRLGRRVLAVALATLPPWAGCFTELAALPDDATAYVGVFWDEDFGYGEAYLSVESEGCVALSPDVRMTLNDAVPDFYEIGGRGRDPGDAFNPDCGPPSAYWSFSDAPAEPLVFRLEDESAALELHTTPAGDITRCDFPACSSERRADDDDGPRRPTDPVPVPAEPAP